jgi:hypothetical protein
LIENPELDDEADAVLEAWLPGGLSEEFGCGVQASLIDDRDEINREMYERYGGTVKMPEVTRFEVIDHRAGEGSRLVVLYDVQVELDVQDAGRTLKVFLTDRGENGAL